MRKQALTLVNLLSISILIGATPIARAHVPALGAISGDITIQGKRKAGDAVVWLEGGAKSVSLVHAVVDQRNKTFLPHVSVVTCGTKIEFPNNDSVFHNVYAYFQAKKFDLGMYPHGATKTVTFDKTGLVSLLCNVHSDMSAYIMVVDTPYYTVADAQGRFQLSNVPAGAYTLHSWHESGATSIVPINVGATATPLRISLSRK